MRICVCIFFLTQLVIVPWAVAAEPTIYDPPSAATSWADLPASTLLWLKNMAAQAFDTKGFIVLLTGAGSVVGLRKFCDKRLHCHIKNLPSGPKVLLVPLDAVGWGGPSLALMAVQAWAWQQPQAAVAHFGGLACAFLLSHALKRSIRRGRPSQKNENSFPSAHTAVAFASATHIFYQYGGPPWGGLAYLVATGVGWQRVRTANHWLSDVVAGAIIGFVLARGATTAPFFSEL